MTLIAGAQVGSYEILSRIGLGGMGEVYKARDSRLNRLVAIKLLHAEVADRADRRARFEIEARAVSEPSKYLRAVRPRGARRPCVSGDGVSGRRDDL